MVMSLMIMFMFIFITVLLCLCLGLLIFLLNYIPITTVVVYVEWNVVSISVSI